MAKPGSVSRGSDEGRPLMYGRREVIGKYGEDDGQGIRSEKGYWIDVEG